MFGQGFVPAFCVEPEGAWVPDVGGLLELDWADVEDEPSVDC